MYRLTANHLGAFATALTDRMSDADMAGGSSAAALLTLLHRGALPVTALADIVGLSQSAASRLIDRLKGEGLLTARPGREGRERPVALTAKGKRVAKGLQSARLGALNAALASLTDDERRRLDALLRKMFSAIVEGRAEARHICRFCDHANCIGPDCPVGSRAAEIEAAS